MGVSGIPCAGLPARIRPESFRHPRSEQLVNQFIRKWRVELRFALPALGVIMLAMVFAFR